MSRLDEQALVAALETLYAPRGYAVIYKNLQTRCACAHLSEGLVLPSSAVKALAAPGFYGSVVPPTGVQARQCSAKQPPAVDLSLWTPRVQPYVRAIEIRLGCYFKLSSPSLFVYKPFVQNDWKKVKIYPALGVSYTP